MTAQTRNKNSVASLMNLLRPHKGRAMLSGASAILSQGCGLLPFLLVYFLVKEIAGKPLGDMDQGLIWRLISAGIVAVVLKHLFLGLSTSLSHKIAYDVLYDLRVRISERLARLPLGYFNERTTGEIKKVMLEDVEQMEVFIGHNMPEFTGAFLHIVLSTGVLFVFDWRLALATISVWPVGFLAQALMVSTGKNRALTARYYSANENVNAAMVQYIQGMPVIKAFLHTTESFMKYATSIRESARCEDALCERYFIPMSVFSVAVNANMLVLLPVGALMYLAGSVTLSTFTLFLLIGLGLGAPLFHFTTLGGTMARNLEGKKRIDAILDARPLPEPPASKIPGENAVYGRQVEFSFKENKVLKGLDFEIPAKHFIALVGPSGAGKTTLARLILRFWDVESGSIRLGGDTDIREMHLENLMDRITFVFQDIYLFNDTILANLKMGNPDATRTEVEKAARAARCHEFIARLPDGYESRIGEKGAKISGGEKQRLCIARALLKNAPILVLDEATAFVDPENEALIQSAINALANGKTLIVIAHRLSTIAGADRIIVIDRGRIVEQESHEALLRAQTLYKRMWDTHVASLGWNF